MYAFLFMCDIALVLREEDTGGEIEWGKVVTKTTVYPPKEHFMERTWQAWTNSWFIPVK